MSGTGVSGIQLPLSSSALPLLSEIGLSPLQFFFLLYTQRSSPREEQRQRCRYRMVIHRNLYRTTTPLHRSHVPQSTDQGCHQSAHHSKLLLSSPCGYIRRAAYLCCPGCPSHSQYRLRQYPHKPACHGPRMSLWFPLCSLQCEHRISLLSQG